MALEAVIQNLLRRCFRTVKTPIIKKDIELHNKSNTYDTPKAPTDKMNSFKVVLYCAEHTDFITDVVKVPCHGQETS